MSGSNVRLTGFLKKSMQLILVWALTMLFRRTDRQTVRFLVFILHMVFRQTPIRRLTLVPR